MLENVSNYLTGIRITHFLWLYLASISIVALEPIAISLHSTPSEENTPFHDETSRTKGVALIKCHKDFLLLRSAVEISPTLVQSSSLLVASCNIAMQRRITIISPHVDFSALRSWSRLLSAELTMSLAQDAHFYCLKILDFGDLQ